LQNGNKAFWVWKKGKVKKPEALLPAFFMVFIELYPTFIMRNK